MNRLDKTVTLSGYPTVQWTAGEGFSKLAGDVTADKIGAYRGPASFPLTIWQDGFVRTTSFAAARRRAPLTPVGDRPVPTPARRRG